MFVGGVNFAYLFNVDTSGGNAGEPYGNNDECGNAASGTSYF